MMAIEQLQNADDCPVREDARFQALTWRIERLGWIFMAGVVLAAGYGLFGGPTSTTSVRDASGRLEVSYPYFQRHLAPSEFAISVDARSEPIVNVVVDQAFAAAFEIRTVAPVPLESLALDGGVHLKFAVSGENKDPLRVVLTGIPRRFGSVSGKIGVAGQAPAAINLFVYP